MTVQKSTCRCCNQPIVMIKSVEPKVVAKWTHRHSGLAKCGDTYAQPMRQDKAVFETTEAEACHGSQTGKFCSECGEKL